MVAEFSSLKFNSVHSLSYVWLFVTQWTTELHASLSITNTLKNHPSPPGPNKS